MNTPAWRSLHPTHVRRNDQHGQNFVYPIDRISPKAQVILILNEAPGPCMSHAADIRIHNRTSIPTAVKRLDNLAFQTQSLHVSWQTLYWALKN